MCRKTITGTLDVLLMTILFNAMCFSIFHTSFAQIYYHWSKAWLQHFISRISGLFFQLIFYSGLLWVQYLLCSGTARKSRWLNCFGYMSNFTSRWNKTFFGFFLIDNACSFFAYSKFVFGTSESLNMPQLRSSAINYHGCSHKSKRTWFLPGF
jgi:hypothetical protein